jgi:Gas vesicle synthesis protein GvpL/GvpF
MERGAILPLRFGTRLESEEELATALSERREPLLRALARVRGRVELGVRALVEREERPLGERSGRDYLLGRVAEHRRSEQVARELHEPLAELAVASRRSERPPPPAIMVGSYLVEEAKVEHFRERADALGRRQQGVRVVVTGPWAPYSFAEEEQR